MPEKDIFEKNKRSKTNAQNREQSLKRERGMKKDIGVKIKVPPKPEDAMIKRSPTKVARQIASDAITTVAENFHNHFELKGTTWNLKLDNIPSLEQSYQLISDVIGMQNGIEWLGSESSWLMGNIVHELRRIYGNEIDEERISKLTNRTWFTLNRSEYVYSRFKGNRVQGVSFTNHKQVLEVKDMEDEERITALHISKRLDLTSKELRKLCNLIAAGDKSLLTEEDDMVILNKIDEKTIKETSYLLISYDQRVRTAKESQLTDELARASMVIIKTAPEYEVIKIDNK